MTKVLLIRNGLIKNDYNRHNLYNCPNTLNCTQLYVCKISRIYKVIKHVLAVSDDRLSFLDDAGSQSVNDVVELSAM